MLASSPPPCPHCVPSLHSSPACFSCGSRWRYHRPPRVRGSRPGTGQWPHCLAAPGGCALSTHRPQSPGPSRPSLTLTHLGPLHWPAPGQLVAGPSPQLPRGLRTPAVAPSSRRGVCKWGCTPPSRGGQGDAQGLSPWSRCSGSGSTETRKQWACADIVSRVWAELGGKGPGRCCLGRDSHGPRKPCRLGAGAGFQPVMGV